MNQPTNQPTKRSKKKTRIPQGYSYEIYPEGSNVVCARNAFESQSYSPFRAMCSVTGAAFYGTQFIGSRLVYTWSGCLFYLPGPNMMTSMFQSVYFSIDAFTGAPVAVLTPDPVGGLYVFSNYQPDSNMPKQLLYVPSNVPSISSEQSCKSGMISSSSGLIIGIVVGIIVLVLAVIVVAVVGIAVFWFRNEIKAKLFKGRAHRSSDAQRLGK